MPSGMRPNGSAAMWFILSPLVSGQTAVCALAAAEVVGRRVGHRPRRTGAELVRLDPTSGDRTDSIEVGDPTTIGHLAIGDGKVWLAACGLVRIDIDEAEVVQSNDDPAACGPIAYGAGAVWRVMGRELVKLDPSTGEQASARLPGRVDRDVVAEGVDLAAGPEGVF